MLGPLHLPARLDWGGFGGLPCAKRTQKQPLHANSELPRAAIAAGVSHQLRHELALLRAGEALASRPNNARARSLLSPGRGVYSVTRSARAFGSE